jgi:cytidylate kinase
MFNVVTVAREYGSGGSDIGRRVAELLGWECLDKQIIERVAAKGKVDRAWAEKADELTPTWWDRVMKSISYGSPEAYVEEAVESETDRDQLQKFTANVIDEAGKQGKCVIIGRSAQCVLRHAPHVLHVLAYAPLAEKIERMKLRHPQEPDLPALLRRMDSERAHYTQNYYGYDWSNRALYQLCVNSTMGIDACAGLIVQAIRQAETRQ